MPDAPPIATEPTHANPPGADLGYWMERGTELDMAGHPEQALAAFERARALSPMDVNAVSACATLLSALDCPQAAYRTLLSVEAGLMQSADGAANLAIAAEGCGDLAKAQSAYARALELDPAHLRSLNNVAILSGSASQWDHAIHLARRCIALQPDNALYHANLAEYLSGARRYAEALEGVRAATARFPAHAELKIRHITLMAFIGEIENADVALKTLDPETRSLLQDFLLKLETAEASALEGAVRGKAADHAADDGLRIHMRQAFRNMAACDWRHHRGLDERVRQALAGSVATGRYRDWGDASYHGLVLGIDEDTVLRMCVQQLQAAAHRFKACPPFKASTPAPGAPHDGRIQVGLAVQSLADPLQAQALQQQLALHDSTQFSVHVYAFTGRPDPLQQETLRPHAASVNELGHMSDLEAAGRIRLDRLDLYVEYAWDPAWTRQEIALMRVAPVQLRHPGLFRLDLAGTWDYRLTDHLIHPGPEGRQDHTEPAAPWQLAPLVRLPETCWPGHFGPTAGQAPPSREKAGLPLEDLVLCSCLQPPLLDEQTFSCWMKIMRSLPDAVLWLPWCSRAAHNLVREAQAAGVGAQRLIFSSPSAWPEVAGHLGCADLFLDSLRLNAAPGLEHALSEGVPALSHRGAAMAGRMGASMLQAAGLPECILETPDSYAAEAIRLGRNPAALAQLRDKLRAVRSSAPLFDTAARVKDLESAWAQMVKRTRAGLAPAAFDVPSAANPPAG
jgi:protein O-GlcNAc transferase